MTNRGCGNRGCGNRVNVFSNTDSRLLDQIRNGYRAYMCSDLVTIGY